MKKLIKVIDNVLLVIILLSIVQIVLEDISIIQSWGENFSMMMVYAGVAFDLIFSIEFIVRSIFALRDKRFKQYFLYEKGWIDFVASVPLLLTSSGPMFLMAITGRTVSGARSMVNVLKVVKAIRVTRILRLLRTLKIFGKIENIFSRMSQHHISTIASYVVTISVGVFMLFSVTGILNFSENIVTEARVSLTFTSVMIANVLLIAFFYARNFAQNVSDPIYVIKRGMKEEDYNLTVKIKEPFRKEEVFELAEAYNSVWLPMKMRIQTIREQKRKEAQRGAMPDEDYSDLL